MQQERYEEEKEMERLEEEELFKCLSVDTLGEGEPRETITLH